MVTPRTLSPKTIQLLRETALRFKKRKPTALTVGCSSDDFMQIMQINREIITYEIL